MKAETTIARLFSSLLHPLVIPTLGMIILFNIESYVAYSIPLQARRFVLLIVFVNTALAPLLSVFMLKKTKIIDDILLDERKDRLVPLILSAIYFFITYYLLRKVAMPSIIYFYVLGASVLIVLCFIISLRWKISLHMASAGGLTGFLIISSWLLNVSINHLIILCIICSGMLGFSRIRLNAHTPGQVYAGYLLGVGTMLLLFLYLRL